MVGVSHGGGHAAFVDGWHRLGWRQGREVQGNVVLSVVAEQRMQVEGHGGGGADGVETFDEGGLFANGGRFDWQDGVARMGGL